MTDFKLNDDHDLAIENNQLVLINNKEEIRQMIVCRLKTFKNEWFLNSDLGIPYYEDILKKDIQPSIVEALLINAILETPGVIRMETFEADLSPSRQLSVRFEALTIDGPVIGAEDL